MRNRRDRNNRNDGGNSKNDKPRINTLPENVILVDVTDERVRIDSHGITNWIPLDNLDGNLTARLERGRIVSLEIDED